MDCSQPGSAVRRISQARILEWGAIPFSRGSSCRGSGSPFPALAGQFFTTAPLGRPLISYTPTVFVQSLSFVWLFAASQTAAHQAPLCFTISQSLFKFMSIELVMPSNHLTLCCSLLLLPSIFPSITIFSNELALHIRWPKYLSFSISLSNEYSWLISFRIDWLDLHAVQVTLKSLLKHHNLKTTVLWLSAFFMVQFSHPYTTTGKTIALIIRAFVGKVIRPKNKKT